MSGGLLVPHQRLRVVHVDSVALIREHDADLMLADGVASLITDVKFKTYGCGSAIASSTMFVEMLKGRTIEEAKLIKDKDIADALQLPPIKLHCSVLAEGSIKRAIEDWEQKCTKI